MIFDLAAWRGALTPQRPAVWHEGRWLSYGALARRAERLAARLHALGVAPGERVGVLAPNHPVHLEALLAAPKLGFVHTPFNHRLAAPELGALLREIAPRLVLAARECAPLLEASAAPVVFLDRYEDWLADCGSLPPPPALSADHPWMLLFTGGSTGVPKGALIPYRQVFANAVNTVLAWELGAADCAIQATPMFHAAVNVLATPLLYAGGRVVLMSAFDPQEYLQLARAHGATLWFMVPTMYQRLLGALEREPAPPPRLAISGGAPCPLALIEAFRVRGLPLRQGYGLTEAGVNCFALDEAQARAHPDAVGLPMPLLRAAIRRADGSECATDEIGELTLSGPAVFSGYYGKPEETAQALRGGWLWTGDLARRDAQGLHYLVGRRKEMYISGGENVYPAEIEAALAAHPAVAECAVLGVSHPDWGETGLACVALKPGTSAGTEALRAFLRERLAAYKLPRAFLFLDELPKTAAGKIDKPALRKRYQAASAQEEKTHGASVHREA